MAELVPGVSGGTLALIVGVYDRIIDSANHVVHGLKTLITGPRRWSSFTSALGRAEWGLLIPLVIGMAGIVATMAGVMENFVVHYPELSRGLFFGMVATSLVVPLSMVDWSFMSGGRRVIGGIVVLAVAALLFWATGLGSATNNPNPPLLLVFGAAAIAICALVLPGVSGSFFLLTIGIYAATTGAVADRNITYLLVFAAGALLGLSLFVKLLHHMLHNHRSWTMLAITGLMLGSLRALWPWLADDRTLHPVGDNWLPVLGLMLAGAALVTVLLIIDRRLATHVEN